MCEGFMEPENNLNDYKPISVQEDMYADRLEWIPKVMTPTQEYSTLVSILERHPCQSLRCLDKLTAQIYGGTEGSRVVASRLKGDKKLSTLNWQHKPEYKDKMDDVLKQMYRGDAFVEMKEEVIKKNKEYLIMEESVDKKSIKSRKLKNGRNSFAMRDKRETNNAKFSPQEAIRHLKVRDAEHNTQLLLPDNFDVRKDTSLFRTFDREEVKDLADRADSLIDNVNATTHELDTNRNDVFITDNAKTIDSNGITNEQEANSSSSVIPDAAPRPDKSRNIDETTLSEGVREEPHNAPEGIHDSYGSAASVKTTDTTSATGAAAAEEDGPGECASVITSRRYECYPELGASEAACVARGCCWLPLEAEVRSTRYL